jgi:phosphoribosyl 1,2-cyclic phosphodiesterase
MKITFWGVRGSIPTPGPDTVETGGNTSCIEVRCGERLLVFDGGTGLRLLGQRLLKELPVEAYLFFSHVHWDHIQGFPFFAPAFIPGNKIHLFGGHNVSRTLEETLAGQMDYPSFPVHLSEMGSKMSFRDLFEGEVFELAPDIKVSNARGNHPNGVYAYRVDYQGKSVVYATDTEHYSIVDPKLKRLCKDADVLIYDAMYTPEEYAGEVGGGPKTGWGHSTFVEGAALAKAAGVKQLVLHHHDPGQNDAAVREKERRCREIFPNSIAAREGVSIDLLRPSRGGEEKN